MPLNTKGEKIMRKMQKEYGKERGKRVFYASRNKGTINNVEKHNAVRSIRKHHTSKLGNY